MSSAAETPADTAGAALRRVWRVAVFGVAGVLLLMVVSVGYVQWHQYRLLDPSPHEQDQALGWNFAQLETDVLRMRDQLQSYLMTPSPAASAALSRSYEAFAGRLERVDHERADGIMRGEPGYRPAIAKIRTFMAQADPYFDDARRLPLSADASRQLLQLLGELQTPLHDLMLTASHLLDERATERKVAIRQHTELALALSVMQCLLMLAFAAIALRQLRVLGERRRHLEALADNLAAARHEAEAANRAKGAFLANMSHEIRTPFHGMLGMMSLLQDSSLSPQQALQLDTARESAEHLLDILNDILDVSQLDSGKLQVSAQTVDLLQLVAQVESLMQAHATAKSLGLQVEVAAEVPRWVLADPTRVKQILFNLLNNAIKFTPSGSIVLAVTRQASGRIDFTVTDPGIGMDEATLGRLFQRFVQGDDSPSRRASGAGLGLEISRDLARLMGGDITVQSRVGRGSRFVASLPLSPVTAPGLGRGAADAATGSAPVPAELHRLLRVLVAEDHPVNRAYLEAVLDKLGHHGVFVTDGEGAVQALQRQPDDAPFDIVLMDLHMPGMDGFAAARAIRAMPGPRSRIPIVALTADAFQASREEARAAGMDGFLTKPAHLPQLREALERHGSSLHREERPMPRAARAASAAPAAPAASAASTIADAVAQGPSQQGLATSPLLDLATIAEMQQALSPTRYRELLGGFFDARGAAILTLRRLAAEAAADARADAHANAPADDLKARSHALKGAAASLGLPAVASALGQLETTATTASADACRHCLDEIEALFDRSLAECIATSLLPAPAPSAPA